MPNNELQELLGARFERYTHATNESVWTAIEAQLDAEKSDRIEFWFWILNGFAATLLIGIMVHSGIQSQLMPHTPISTAITPNELKNEGIEKPADLAEINHSSAKNGSTFTLSAMDSAKNEIGNAYFKQIKVDKSRSKGQNSSTGDLVSEKMQNEQSNLLKNPVPFAHVNPIASRKLASYIDETKVLEILPNSILVPKTAYFERLPIHLGLEFTYLNDIRLSTKSSPSATSLDSSYEWTNEQLAKNRHVEFNLFSQFDLTPRFSASIGFGYSQSQFTLDSPTGVTTLADPGPFKANQRLFVIPLQVKYAFFQKNRFALSAGLTAQSEFGRNEYTESSIENPTVTGFPLENTEESLVVSKQPIRQFALEPFMQLTVAISPRFSTYTNIGYRTYFGNSSPANSQNLKTNFLQADFGLLFRIH